MATNPQEQQPANENQGVSSSILPPEIQSVVSLIFGEAEGLFWLATSVMLLAGLGFGVLLGIVGDGDFDLLDYASGLVSGGFLVFFLISTWIRVRVAQEEEAGQGDGGHGDDDEDW